MEPTLDKNGIEVFTLNTFLYFPVSPQADNEDFAAKGQRVLVYHRRKGCGRYSLEIQIVPRGIVHAGTVIGIIDGN